MRSAENVLDEIEYLVNKYGIREVFFQDDNMTISNKRMQKICEGIIERGIDLTWTCPSGVYIPSLSESLLALMRKAGCYSLSFGIESGDQRILDDIIHKKQKLSYVKKVVEWCKKFGIKTTGYFILGIPGETINSMMKTINFASSCGLERARFHICQPFPSTELHKNAVSKGYLTEDFDPTHLRVRTDTPVLRTKEFSPEDILRLKNIAEETFRKKNR